MNSMLEVLLSSLIPSLPQIAIATVGLALVHTRLRRMHPRAYLYGALGLILLLANGLLGVATTAYMQVYVTPSNGAALANKITAANLVGFVVLTGSLILILVALLADRNADKNSRVAA